MAGLRTQTVAVGRGGSYSDAAAVPDRFGDVPRLGKSYGKPTREPPALHADLPSAFQAGPSPERLV